MTRSQKRRTVLLTILLLILLLVSAWYANFRATKKLDINIELGESDSVTAPEYLYSFSGTGETIVVRPLGVLVDGDQVFVTDSRRGEVFVFTPEGDLIKTFGKGQVGTPLYVAKNPKDGNLYISDRKTKTVNIFKRDGTYVGVFDPKLPKEELPAFDTKGDQWVPVAIAFAPDGRMYVSELLNGHRLLVFDKDGKFVRSVGAAGEPRENTEGPELFQFPNNIKIIGDEVLVADSNNRRLQVFDLDGTFKRIIPVGGLPRGMGVLSRTSEDTATVDRIVVIDTLAHDATIWNIKGENLVTFGTRGVLEGQFSYPGDVSIGAKNLIFITDSENARVQVWGWPEEISPLPPIRVSTAWRWCLAPLLLLPLLLLLRRRRYVATRDFVEDLYERESLALMDVRRVRWHVLPEDYEVLKDLEQMGFALVSVLESAEYSESDAQALSKRLEIDEAQARIMALAQRSKLFCTNDLELRRLAKLLELAVADSDEFAQRKA